VRSAACALGCATCPWSTRRPEGAERRETSWLEAFLRRSGTAIGALTVGGSLRSIAAAATSGSVIYSGFGGIYEQGIRQAVLTPFQQQTGTQVEVTTGASSIAKIRAMVSAKRTEWDLVDATGPAFGQLLDANVLQKLDTSIVNASDLASPKYIGPYGVAIYAYSHNIFWNKKVIGGPLNSWADVWNVSKFPGKRGFQSVPWYTLEIALVADGVPLDKLYPLDVDRAFRSLDKIKGHAAFLDLNTLTNLVAQQEIVTGDLNLARIQKITKDGVPLAYNWKQTLVDVERWPVLIGAPHPAQANQLINFAIQPEQQLQILKVLGYSPTNKKAIAQIDPEQAKDLPGTPATAPDSFYLDPDWWAKNGKAVEKRFQEWLLTAR
jgi:putative spermidine/putrescine transport system substrate-binding protein